ncbi:hypothetical protein DTO027B5_2920 [Paecilomyces variotii]|nr:hypothetical protein DTO027B3_6053 [Paecilomyces variotii]KAJ9335224.1 hypothetical protein DTO027B5_2920 [Paecilomyces variotii]
MSIEQLHPNHPYTGTSTPLSPRSSFSINATTPATPATGTQTSATGTNTPDPLLGHRSDYFSQNEGGSQLRTAPPIHPLVETLKISSHEASQQEGDSQNGDAVVNLTSRDIPLGPVLNRRPSVTPSHVEAAGIKAVSQGVPPELRNFASEIVLIFVCSAGLMLFSFLLGDVIVTQQQFKNALGIKNTELPWLVGAFNVANGMSVVISGSIADLVPPKRLMVSAFLWLTVWNVVGAFSLTPSRYVLFFIVRAMQGLAIGVLVSGCMSILGRVYKPGLRKNRVFSAMAATAPFGFFLGAIQGGALYTHLQWVFGTNAILTSLCAIAAYFSIPALRPVADVAGADAPTLRQFDILGAGLAVSGCVCLLFGLTQGSVTSWSPYTYALIVVGILSFVGLFFAERRVPRPLIPSRLWKTKGFTPLMIAYFLGFGSFFGAWQFYAIQFWLRIQHASPLTVGLYHLPNAIVGVFATWVVSRTLHLVPGHYIYTVSMLAFTLGPAFFLPQKADTIYWALSLPGVALVTFGPDLAFAAASIFITSNVARSYQGTAGSLLVTNQNLSSAIMTSVADAIGSRVDKDASGAIGLDGLRAIWWFALSMQLVAALVTIIWVRIPKEEEKEHVT